MSRSRRPTNTTSGTPAGSATATKRRTHTPTPGINRILSRPTRRFETKYSASSRFCTISRTFDAPRAKRRPARTAGRISRAKAVSDDNAKPSPEIALTIAGTPARRAATEP
ncbi:MAG: hypothetical protein OHK0044_09910 [Burkholderiaceae bacterium]